MQMNEINLTLDECSNGGIWNQLFKNVDGSYDITYFTYKNRRYVNCSNTWYYNRTKQIMEDMKNNGVKCCHSDHECKTYCDEHKLNVYNRKIANPNDIVYVFGGYFTNNNDNNNDNDNDNDNKKNCEIINNIKELNINFKPSEIVFVCPLEFVIKNRHGFNNDHRGSDHTLIKLPFVTEVNLGTRFTLQDLIVSYFNLKSHKFDKWYELYIGASSVIHGSKIIVDLNFDHGS